MAADLTTNLELAWLCQDSSGSTVTDSSGNGRDGTYAGTMGSVAGPGGALALGIGLGVGATRSSTFTIDWDAWTVSLWIKGTAHGSAYGDVFSIGGDKLVVRVDDNGGVDGDTLVLLTYDAGYEAETISLGSTLLDDDWHHVLADCDGANCHLYIDNVLIASPAHTRNAVATSAYVTFGSSHASVGFPSGSASGLRVYGERVLDADSRQAAYDEGTASGLTLDASPATITATPQSAGLNIGRTITASPAAITVTPQSAGLNISRTLTASPATITVTPQSSTLTITAAGPADLVAAPGSITVTPQVAGLIVSRILAASPGAIVVTPQSSTLTIAATPTTVYRGKRMSSIPGSKSFRSIPRGVVGRWA